MFDSNEEIKLRRISHAASETLFDVKIYLC